jgi:hypothetical protein
VKTHRCNVTDLFGITSRTLTDEGYLIAPAKLARAGNVQVYRARELGLDGGDKEIRLYRPKDQVFSADTIASYQDKPLTLKHPPKGVNAKNWKAYAVGDLRGVGPQDEHLGGTIIVRDAAAVRAVLDGTSQLSTGYECDVDMTPGTTPDGHAYDGVMTRITANHQAIVDVARGGPECRVADEGDRPMTKIVLDGITLELDETQASYVTKIVGDSDKRAKEAKDAATAATAALETAEAALQAEKDKGAKLVADHATKVAELEAQIVKPEQIEAMAAERVTVVGDALKFIPEFKAEGKTVSAIRSEVVTHVITKDEALKPVAVAVLGGEDVTKAKAEDVTKAFAVIVAAKGKVEDAATPVGDSPLGRALAGGNKPTVQKLTGSALQMARMKNWGKPLEDTAAK